MTIDEARKKVMEATCSDCIRQDCPNPGKKMDTINNPCRYKKKDVKREGKTV